MKLKKTISTILIACILFINFVTLSANDTQNEILYLNNNYILKQVNQLKIQILNTKTNEKEYVESVLQEDGTYKHIVTNKNGKYIV